MIAGEIRSLTNAPSAPSSDDGFLALLPRIETHARVVFRGLPAVDREEAIAEAVAAAYVAYRRLRDRGIDPVREFPSMMASYAGLQVKDGRHVGTKSSSKDVLSRKAPRRHGFKVQPLPISTRRAHEEVHSSRVHYLHYDPTDEQLAALMLTIAAQGWPAERPRLTRLAAWHEHTGKSARAFYRRLREINGEAD